MPTENELEKLYKKNIEGLWHPLKATQASQKITIGIDFTNNKVKVDMPEKYIINKDATVLIWKDGSKTIVKRCEDDEFNPRLAFLTAFFQHYCGMSKNKANKYLSSLEIEETKKDEKNKLKSKFKVGDKVKFRKDLKANKKYDGIVCLKPMSEYKGKEVTITLVLPNNTYMIKEDDPHFIYSRTMFEGGE